MTDRNLATAAIVCGMLAIRACLMGRSAPRRSLADLQAEAHRL